MSSLKAEASLIATQAERLCKSTGDLVSLRTPATVRADIREELVAEGGLGMAVGAVIDAAENVYAPGIARPLHSLMAIMVARGRDNGMGFAELFDAMNSAFQDACVARAEQEAHQAKLAEQAAGGGKLPPDVLSNQVEPRKQPK